MSQTFWVIKNEKLGLTIEFNALHTKLVVSFLYSLLADN